MGTLAFVFELNHLNVRMFQSRQYLGRCACALSRIMFVTMHGQAVRSLLYCESLEASSRVHVCDVGRNEVEHVCRDVAW